MVLACVTWGLSALFYREVIHVPPLEVLSHRTIWSLVLILAWLGYQRRLKEVAAVFRKRASVLIILFAALMISMNWGVYIYSVQLEKIVESSIGYYIFPLCSVALGAIFMGDRLSALQWLAVSLAALGVIVLTLGLGVAPYVSLFLAITFALYGLSKKNLAVGPVVSVLAEVTLLLPLALIWLYGAHVLAWSFPVEGPSGFFSDPKDILILILSGPMTAVPLMLMAFSLRNLTLSTVGLIQYVNPTIQFGIAGLLLGEPVTKWHIYALILIWIALACYSTEAVRKERAMRR